ncbi:hypothetical protein OO184_09505 [Photorhabdus sp. APURE]|uniref:hypothetical protein n=1 Tax=Photorhabdus aballayi TaxID=2991723 RepID=UPI00223D0353|nr:hypothetical protein [Photorhabdus aballayi]MCW7548165.1 hypothetical protein [Photorhabdus aballayi]
METSWKDKNETLGTINVGGIQYFYGQSRSENRFFIQKFINDQDNSSEAYIERYAAAGKVQVGAVIVWRWQFNSVIAVGHAAFVLFDHSDSIRDPQNTYISWWPTGGIASANRGLASPPDRNRTYAKDKEAEGGKNPKSFIIYSSDFNVLSQKIKKWWADFQSNETRWALSQNCATTVKDLLVYLGAYTVINDNKISWYYAPGFWTPENIISMGNDINESKRSLR